jgi:molybdenum cofactor cytidylyltransferase
MAGNLSHSNLQYDLNEDRDHRDTSISWSNTFAIILAAGFSTRMGTCKADLPWQGKTLLTYQCTQFLEIGVTPIVILGMHNIHCKNHCPEGSIVVINPHPKRGKTSSILSGLQVLPGDFTALILSAVDQPRSTCVYDTLLQNHYHANATITAPTFQGKLGHPLVFAPRVLPDLLTIREETLGIRQVVQTFYNNICRVEFSLPSVLLDLNTPEIYKCVSFAVPETA